MGQIYIIGSEASSAEWANSFGKLIPIVISNVNDSVQIHNFVVYNLKDACIGDKVVIDLDAVDPAVALTIALHIRLSITDLRQNVLLPIMLVSYLPILSFLSLGECSQFFLSQSGFAFCSPGDLTVNINALAPLTIDNYYSSFLCRIQIRPDGSIGPHSLANQWGANVLHRTLLGCDINNPIINKAKSTMYFKYTLAHTYNQERLSSILSGHDETESLPGAVDDLPDATNKKILLIDDEAEKGWLEVLSHVCRGAIFKPYSKCIDNYDSLDEDIRNNIERDYYDLVFLDLRLNGVKEEDLKEPEDFSGMKILKRIKDINPGTQVIMLTASNKAWNMKALLEKGADGYYIKESPEYAFPFEYSEKNSFALLDEIEYCLKRSYLKRTYRKIEELKSHVYYYSISKSTLKQLNTQLDLSFTLLKKAQEDIEFAYAYISLEAVFEILSKEYLEEIDKNQYRIKETGQECKNWTINKGRCKEDRRQSKDNSKEYPMWKKIASIYYQLLDGDNDQLIIDAQRLIKFRNSFMHQDDNDSDLIEDIYNPSGFIELLDTIHEFVILL